MWKESGLLLDLGDGIVSVHVWASIVVVLRFGEQRFFLAAHYATKCFRMQVFPCAFKDLEARWSRVVKNIGRFGKEDEDGRNRCKDGGE